MYATIGRLLGVWLATAVLAQACVCGMVGTACSAAATTTQPLVVQVRALTGNQSDSPGRVVIEEVIQGQWSGATEMDVPSTRSGCNWSFQPGVSYVVFASLDPARPTVLSVSYCSYSFRLDGNETLKEAFQTARAGGGPMLAGHIEEQFGPFETRMSQKAGLKVVAESSSRRLETLSDEKGQYKFENIPPGKWRLSIDAPGYAPYRGRFSPAADVEVPIRGCANLNPQVTPDGHIEGRLYTAHGAPISGINVQAVAMETRGNTLVATAKTDEEGKFAITGLPQLKYLVGVNIDPYRDTAPYRRVFHPSSAMVTTATPIELGYKEQRRGVNIVIEGERREPSELILEYVDSTGKAIPNVFAILNTVSRRQIGILDDSDERGIVSARLWKGDRYMLRVLTPDGKALPGIWVGPLTAPPVPLRLRVILENGRILGKYAFLPTIR